MAEHTITDADVKGPFTETIPDKLEDMAGLDRLGYTGPSEALAERFHMDEDFLKELNPGKDFGKAGETIQVAAVARAEGKPRNARRIVVDRRRKQVRAYGEDSRPIAVYPATIGSRARPAPTGTHPRVLVWTWLDDFVESDW